MAFQIFINDRDQGWLPYSRLCNTRSEVNRIIGQFERKMPHRMFKVTNMEPNIDIVTKTGSEEA